MIVVTSSATTDGPQRLTISAFARAVGLTPSALRFYDDAGLLAPATVDERNGYRYYDDDQQRRAVLVRQMRELDVPLTRMRAVLDGSADEAERLLTDHVELLTDRADRARTELADILRALRGPDGDRTGPTTFSIGGPELAGAIRQVAPFAAATSEDRLDCLLLDVTAGELTVVGTDRYRLGARTLRLADLDGPDRRLPIRAGDLTDITDWLRRRQRVRVTAAAESLTLAVDDGHDHPEESHHPGGPPTDGADVQRLAVAGDHFPDYRQVLELSSTPAGRHRMIIDRIRLLEVISTDQTGTVVLQPGPDQVLISRHNDPEVRRLPAVCSGPADRVGFSPALLASALQSSVGPDVLIEVAPERAAVVRSADEGSFSTLVMPRRLDEKSGDDDRPE